VPRPLLSTDVEADDQLANQSPAPSFHHVETSLEVIVVSVVGIGNIDGATGTGVELAQHDEALVVAIVSGRHSSSAEQRLLMTAVQTDDQVARGKGVRGKGAGPMAMIDVTTPFESGPGPLVHRLSGVPPSGTGTRDLQVDAESRAVGQQGVAGHRPQDDVAHW
jgi:hypothetical protein